jgi:phosphotriesterase-related protein
MGRKPERLKALSERTGVHIVMATGWYTEAYLPPEDRVDITYASALADGLIEEIQNGVGSTGIRPGVIGEFGPTGDRISPAEERIHRASARAHRATGIGLVTHAMHSEVGLDQLDLLEEEGVDLSKVAIGHCDSWPFVEYWTRIAERGAFVLLDNIGTQMGRHEDRLASLVRAMIEKGYEGNLLLSHDMGTAVELRYYGGRGFVHLAESFLPRLRNLGIPDSVLNTITVENPRRLLAMEVQQ